MVDTNFSQTSSAVASVLGKKVQHISKSIVEQSSAYQKGLIRFSKDQNTLVNTVTGAIYETFEEAIEDSSRFGISSVEIFGGAYGPFSPDNPQFGPLSDFVSNINEYLRLSKSGTEGAGREAMEYVQGNPLLRRLSETPGLELVRISYSDTSEETIRDIAQLYDSPIYTVLDKSGRSIEQTSEELLKYGKISPPGRLSSRER
jgi:hypothetical protein